MSTYNFKEIYTATASDEETILNGRLIFKTLSRAWIGTEKSVILPISIHSRFHKGLVGDLKMGALISTVRKHVKGKMTILLTECCHVQVMSLKYQNDFQKAVQVSLQDAKNLENRFKVFFEECHVTYWQNYINEDPFYEECSKLIRDLYENDLTFQDLVHLDAESTYTTDCAFEFYDKEFFIKKAIEDMLGQLIGLLIFSRKGYRFHFYPGKLCQSTYYANQVLLHDDKKIALIDANLTVTTQTPQDAKSAKKKAGS